jgi:hypothetical protein
MLGGGAVVPYIGSWTGEETLPTTVVRRQAGGIGYADETLTDRDDHDVLWTRVAARIGTGRPEFIRLHPLRQRRAMRDLLCQVCAGPADRTEQGHLWLVPDRRQHYYWDGWPEDMANSFPPVCLPCARLSIRMCPALRTAYVAIRAHSTVSGVVGVRFGLAGSALAIAAEDNGEVIHYDDPDVRWVQATQLARTLRNCAIVDLEKLAR